VVLNFGSVPLDPFVSWDLEFFFAVICFTPFDSERCNELDLTELVATELDCDDVFADALKFTEDDFCSSEEFTLQECVSDSSVELLMLVTEEAMAFDFALTVLVKLFDTSDEFEASKLETETDDFLELTVLEVEETELLFTTEFELVVDEIVDELFVVELLEAAAVDVLLALMELETATDDFFAATLEAAVEDFLAENDFDLATDFTISAADSEIGLLTSCTAFSFSSDATSPVLLDFLSIANSSADIFFIRLLTVSCIRFDEMFASVLAAATLV